MKNSPFTEGGRLENGTGFAGAFTAPQATDNTPQTDEMILASMGDDVLYASVDDLANKALRSMAGAIVLEWADGEPTYQALEDLVIGEAVELKEDDESESMDDDEMEAFNDLFSEVASAMVAFSGKDEKLVQKAIDDENDDLLETISAAITKATEEQDSDEMLADFAVKESLLLASTVTRVKDGKVVRVKKPRRKKRQTAAQKSALKKARKKSHNAAAKAKRKKSMRIRNKRGL